jgi:hypothetical protein
MTATPVTWLKVGDVLDLATAPGGSRITVPPPEVADVVTHQVPEGRTSAVRARLPRQWGQSGLPA